MPSRTLHPTSVSTRRRGEITSEAHPPYPPLTAWSPERGSIAPAAVNPIGWYECSRADQGRFQFRLRPSPALPTPRVGGIGENLQYAAAAVGWCPYSARRWEEGGSARHILLLSLKSRSSAAFLLDVRSTTFVDGPTKGQEGTQGTQGTQDTQDTQDSSFRVRLIAGTIGP